MKTNPRFIYTNMLMDTFFYRETSNSLEIERIVELLHKEIFHSQSSKRKGRKISFKKGHLNILIMDEAHHLTESHYHWLMDINWIVQR
ncbi:MAG TPA: hypothetical protein DEF35_13140 [Paenibacillus sp.]|nr:hypothetical protein CA599_13605 [Paenibacillus taichungensis]HBU82560.1 hypothetical protein [Paenibacillus sp.]